MQSFTEHLDMRGTRVNSQMIERFPLRPGKQVEHLAVQTGPQNGWRVTSDDLSLVYQSNTMETLCFIHVRSGNKNRDALLEEVIQQEPEVATTDRIYACSGLIEK